MKKKMHHHVVYSFNGGRGSATMSSNKQPITAEVIRMWQEWIQENAEVSSVVVENFIEIKG